jgi:UDP-N-acetylmuramoyl-tripeptide--D-alanyl-D-alanine ligase
MSLWSARELAEATGGVLSAPFDAGGVSIDTRTLAPGDLFVALLGEGRDGHAFVADAIAKGAAGAMVHADVSPAAPTLRVDDTLAGLARLGGFARARFDGRLVAVTGSVGKTTTKEMLRTALSAFGLTHAAAASYNNHWGLPLTLALIPRAARFCIAEIGMNHAGEIEPLARLARPHVAVITAIAKAHVGHLGSIEAIANEKAAITRGLEPNGIAVFPADSPQLPLLLAAASGATVMTFGSDPSADVRLLNAEADADGSLIEVKVLGRSVRLRLNAPGRHMALNATATLAAIAALGLDAAKAAAALEDFAPLAGRGSRRALAIPGGTILLLDESYNGNGASMRAALDVLRLQPNRRRIAVLGDMLELGDDGPAEHAGLAEAVEQSADVLFTCGPLMQHLHDSIPPGRRGAHAADSNALAPIVAKAITNGDAVLVKGSLGSGMRRIIATLEAATSRTSTTSAGAA